MPSPATSQKVTCLHLLHEYIDWMETWGDPRTPREEKRFYDLEAQISVNKASLKSLVHELRLHFERFLDDFQKQTTRDNKIGTEFIKKGNTLLEHLSASGSEFSEDEALFKEVQNMIRKKIQEIEILMR